MTSASELLTIIKMDLGIYSLRLPFEKPDETLLEMLRLKTLKTFSIYSPDIETCKLDLNKMKCLKRDFKESCYIIPHLFQEREILYVRSVKPYTHEFGPYFSPVYDGTMDSYKYMGINKAYADLASMVAPPFTFKYEPPNKLYLYNVVTADSQIDVVFALNHADNFSTISATTWHSFYELALLDVKRFLYNTMKHYTELQSAFGSINLKIDDWSNAESERMDLINRWKEVYHLDGEQIYRA